MRKKYNTPHRSRVVKTRLSEDEYADFTARLAPYGISQSEFLRQAIRRTTIRPVTLPHCHGGTGAAGRTVPARKASSHSWKMTDSYRQRELDRDETCWEREVVCALCGAAGYYQE